MTEETHEIWQNGWGRPPFWNYETTSGLWEIVWLLPGSRVYYIKRTAVGGREKKNVYFTDATKQTLMAIKFSRNKTPCKSLKPYNILWIKMTCYYVEWVFVIFELCVISSKACFGIAGKHRWLSRQVVTTEVTSWPGSANFQGIQHVLGSEILLRSLCTYHETKCFFLRNLNFFSSTHRKRATRVT